jgi:hypothetical protein
MFDAPADGWDAIDFNKYLFYGAAFTIGIDILVYPLEVLKTLTQVDSKVSKIVRMQSRPCALMLHRPAELS